MRIADFCAILNTIVVELSSVYPRSVEESGGERRALGYVVSRMGERIGRCGRKVIALCAGREPASTKFADTIETLGRPCGK